MIVNVKIWMREGKNMQRGNNMGNKVKYRKCKENIPTFVEKMLVNRRKHVGSGGKNIDKRGKI